jgi:hypothetical protein
MVYTDPVAIAAIQDTIRTEQNFIFACGLTGAQLAGAGRRRVLTQMAEHQDRMQTCSQLLAAADIPDTPPAFTPPKPITNAQSARFALANIDNALVGRYADMAAATQGQDRAFAINAGQACARSAVQWGAASQAFPTAE